MKISTLSGQRFNLPVLSHKSACIEKRIAAGPLERRNIHMSHPDPFPFKHLYSIPPLDLTVLRCPVPFPDAKRPVPVLDLDFAILWDEDRDQRVFAALRYMWYSGLVCEQLRFVREYSGHLTLTLSEAFDYDKFGREFSVYRPETLPCGSLEAYEEEANAVAQRWADPWLINVRTELSPFEIELVKRLHLGATTSKQGVDDVKMLVPAGGWFSI
jgi:hypothetical protein